MPATCWRQTSRVIRIVFMILGHHSWQFGLVCFQSTKNFDSVEALNENTTAHCVPVKFPHIQEPLKTFANAGAFLTPSLLLTFCRYVLIVSLLQSRRLSETRTSFIKHICLESRLGFYSYINSQQLLHASWLLCLSLKLFFTTIRSSIGSTPLQK